MSYALKIWSTNKVETTIDTRMGDYVITVDESVLVEDEDIPTHILLSRKVTRYLTEVHIQPYTEDPEIIKATLKIAKRIAKSSDGSIENPQDENGNDAISGQFKKEKDPETVNITWYMVPKTSLDVFYPLLIDAFEKYMPNALPRRYGDYEPPQYKYQETGRKHFIQCIETSIGGIVWYPTSPILDVFISDATKNKNNNRVGFKSNVIKMIVLKEAYLEHSWNKALIKMFKEVALILDPFYADIVDSKKSNIIGWWWKGLPPQRGYATIIGRPYLDLITKVSIRGTKLSDNLVFLTDSENIRFPRKYIFREKKFNLAEIFQFISKKLENEKYESILVLVINDKIFPTPIKFVTKKSLNPLGFTFSKLSSDKYMYARAFPFDKIKEGNVNSSRQSNHNKTSTQSIIFKIRNILVLIFLFTVVSFITGLVFALGMSMVSGFSWMSVLFGPLYWGLMIMILVLFSKYKKYQNPNVGGKSTSIQRSKSKSNKTENNDRVKENVKEIFTSSDKKVIIENYEFPQTPKQLDGPLIHSLDYGDPDIQAEFTNSRLTKTTIVTGYRGAILIKDKSLTTGTQSFLNADSVNYNEIILSNIKFITPENYPATLWIGRVLRVYEGNRVVGTIKVTKIYNKSLDRDLAIPCVDAKKVLSNYDLHNKLLKIRLNRSGSIPFDVEILRDFPELSGIEIQNLTYYINSEFTRVYDLLVKQMDFKSLEFGNGTNNAVTLEFPWLTIETIEKFKHYVARVNM